MPTSASPWSGHGICLWLWRGGDRTRQDIGGIWSSALRATAAAIHIGDAPARAASPRLIAGAHSTQPARWGARPAERPRSILRIRLPGFISGCRLGRHHTGQRKADHRAREIGLASLLINLGALLERR